MDILELSSLISRSESDVLEFKASTVQLKPAFETVCAFLNGKGETVLIGVKDDGQIIGQDISDKTKLEIANEAKKIEQSVTLEIQYIHIEKNKYVISIFSNTGAHIPYVYDGCPFNRNGSQTERMSQHRYEQLIVKRGHLNHSWEEFLEEKYSINDLDHEEIYKTVSDGIKENRIPASAQRENIKQILKRLNLMKDNKLNRAAVVLYAKQDEIKFFQCMIKMARFKGLNKLGDFIDNQQLYGNTFHILSEADTFLRRHLPIASFFKSDHARRIDKPSLPVMAVSEALINAICHRDYSNIHTDISLAIYDDRLEIWNNCILLDDLTFEKLKHSHESILRNKFIANAFYVRGWIEKWGSGINKILELCKEDKLPEPTFEERTGGLVVTFKFKEIIGGIKASGALNKNAQSELTLRESEILNLLKNS